MINRAMLFTPFAEAWALLGRPVSLVILVLLVPTYAAVFYGLATRVAAPNAESLAAYTRGMQLGSIAVTLALFVTLGHWLIRDLRRSEPGLVWRLVVLLIAYFVARNLLLSGLAVSQANLFPNMGQMLTSAVLSFGPHLIMFPVVVRLYALAGNRPGPRLGRTWAHLSSGEVRYWLAYAAAMVVPAMTLSVMQEAFDGAGSVGFMSVNGALSGLFTLYFNLIAVAAARRLSGERETVGEVFA